MHVCECVYPNNVLYSACRDRSVSISSTDTDAGANAGSVSKKKGCFFTRATISMKPANSTPVLLCGSIADSNFQARHLRFKPLNAREENLPGI